MSLSSSERIEWRNGTAIPGKGILVKYEKLLINLYKQKCPAWSCREGFNIFLQCLYAHCCSFALTKRKCWISKGFSGVFRQYFCKWFFFDNNNMISTAIPLKNTSAISYSINSQSQQNNKRTIGEHNFESQVQIVGLMLSYHFRVIKLNQWFTNLFCYW